MTISPTSGKTSYSVKGSKTGENDQSPQDGSMAHSDSSSSKHSSPWYSVKMVTEYPPTTGSSYCVKASSTEENDQSAQDGSKAHSDSSTSKHSYIEKWLTAYEPCGGYTKWRLVYGSTEENDQSPQDGSKAHSDSSTSKHSSPSTSGKVFTAYLPTTGSSYCVKASSTEENDRLAQVRSKAYSYSSTRKHSSPSTSGKVVTKNTPSSSSSVDLLEKSKSISGRDRSAISKMRKSRSQVKMQSKTSRAEKSSSSTTPSSSSRMDMLEKSKTYRKRNRSQTKTHKSAVSEMMHKSKSHAKMQSTISSAVPSSPSTGDDVTMTPAKTPTEDISIWHRLVASTRGTPATPTGPKTQKEPKRTIRPSRCKWLMLGGGAVLLVVLIGVLIYFLVAGRQATKVDAGLVTSDNSTEQTPALDVTSQEPAIIIGSSSEIALATTEESFELPLRDKVIGGVVAGMAVIYLVAGVAIPHIPCIARPLGVGMYDYSNRPVHAPVGFLDFTLTHPKGTPSEGISLGVWYIPIPKNDLSSEAGTKEKNEALARQDLKADDRYVVLVVLVTPVTRANDKSLYDIFREKPLHYSVVVFDFRGKADSSPAKNVTFKNLVADLRLVYDWILKTAKSPQEVLLYGNSMGTAVIIEMLSMLKPTQSPRAAILVGAHVSLKKTMGTFKFTCLTVLQKVPLYNYSGSGGLQNEYGWDSLAKLNQVNCPLLFIHSKDDSFSSYQNSELLYNAAKKKQPSAAAIKTQIHLFPAEMGYKSTWIFDKSDIEPVIGKFVKSLE